MKLLQKIKRLWRKVFKLSPTATARGYQRIMVKRMTNETLTAYTVSALEWYDLKKDNHAMKSQFDIESWLNIVSACNEAMKEMRRRGLKLPK